MSYTCKDCGWGCEDGKDTKYHKEDFPDHVIEADPCSSCATLRAEVERLRKRDCNATIELCYDNGVDPYSRETLRILDVGVADNIYVVESKVVTTLLAAKEKAEARVRELEYQNKQLEEYVEKGVAFRDELQAEMGLLEEALIGLIKSSDVIWYSGEHGGHDWREAVDNAHKVLAKAARRRVGGGE